MKQHTILRSKVFYQYFLSYTFILLLPLLALGYFSYSHAANKLQIQIEKSMTSEVSNIEQRVQSLQTSIAAIASQIGSNAMFTKYKFTANEYNMMLGIDMLANFKLNHPDIFDILLYYRGEDRLYSARGVSTVRVVNDSIYRYGNWNTESMTSDLNQVETMTVRAAEPVLINGNEKASLVTFLLPIGPPDYRNGTLMFLVKEPNLFRVSQEWIRFNQASILLVDRQGAVLASSDPGEETTRLAGFAVAPEPNASGRQVWTAAVDGQSYKFMLSEPGNGQWSVLSIFPNRVALAEIGLFRQVLERLLFGVLAVGVLCALVFAFIQYRPIRKITEAIFSPTVQRMKPSKVLDKRGNELVWIRRSVDRMIEDQGELVKEEWIERLLRGEASVAQIDDATIGRIHGNRRIDAYFAVLVRLEAEDDLAALYRAKSAIKQRMSASESDRWQAHPVDLLEVGTFAVLVGLGAGEPARLRLESLHVLRREIEAETAGVSAFTVSCGKVVRELDQVNRSFIEALTAMEYRIKYGAGSVILFEDIDETGVTDAWYPLEEQMKYLQSLKQGDRKVAEETLAGMFRDMREREQSLLILKSKCFELVTAVYKTVKELHLAHHIHSLEKMLAFESLQELQERLEQLTSQVCQEVRQIRDNGNQVLMTDIEAYLRAHFNSYALTLESLAEHFSLSPPYMSRLIKEKSGKSFTDWITEMKLEHAKQLLASSDASIREVGESSGYVDYPNFMRRFKKIEGMTPGEYRKLHQNKTRQ